MCTPSIDDIEHPIWGVSLHNVVISKMRILAPYYLRANAACLRYARNVQVPVRSTVQHALIV